MTDAPAQTRRPGYAGGDDETIIGIAADGTRYPVGKLEAHRRNLTHEAISVFVFRDDRLLLQRRAAGKYHSPGLWANTCCSHPRWGETPEDCAARRLREEIGIETPLVPVGLIDYAVPVGALFENEHVHCFAGAGESGLDLSGRDALEADGVTWRSLDEITADLDATPSSFAPWFRIYMLEHRDLLEQAKRLVA